MKNIIVLATITSLLFAHKVVENINIEKFMGKWYVISLVPNFVEKGCSNSSDTYVLNKDGTVSINSQREEDILGIDESIATYKALRENGPWSECFWTGINADRVILDYPDLDPEAWVFVWCDWNGVLAETGDTISAAVHIANRMSPEGLIRDHYVNIDKAPIVTALTK